jgi:hypothetical protein
MGQYLDEKTLISGMVKYEVKIDDLISSDTYDETGILNKINGLKKEDQINLFKAAVQIAIIGAGNKNCGSIRLKNNEIIDLKSIFDKLNVFYNKDKNEKYKPDDLTARRLTRIFRYQIQKFILKNNRSSYLWLKYSDKNKDTIGFCFPGGEHLIETKENALYLYNLYKGMDIKFNTNFRERLQRVFIARDLMSPLDFITIL